MTKNVISAAAAALLALTASISTITPAAADCQFCCRVIIECKTV